MCFGTPAPGEAVAGEWSGGRQPRGSQALAPGQSPPSSLSQIYLEMGPMLRWAPNSQELCSWTGAPCLPTPGEEQFLLGLLQSPRILGPLFTPLTHSSPAFYLPSSALGPGKRCEIEDGLELFDLSFPGTTHRWPAWGTLDCPARGTAWAWQCSGSWRGGWVWQRAGHATHAVPPTSPWPRSGMPRWSCSGRGDS